jgi:hypothetical protein
MPLPATATSQDTVYDILNALPYFWTEVPIPFHGPFQIEAQTADDIPSRAMSNNMYQSYAQYPDNQLIPQPSFSGNLSMGYNDQPYQQWLPDPNAPYSIPLSTSSYVSNASITPTMYNLNDIHVESSMAGSHFAMMSNDGSISSPFPNDGNFYSHGM